jgi:hypothetical protein
VLPAPHEPPVEQVEHPPVVHPGESPMTGSFLTKVDPSIRVAG